MWEYGARIEVNPTKDPDQKTVISPPRFLTQKGLVPRYTANIDKMMNSDSIFIKFFKIKAPNFNITQLLRDQTDTPKARKHAWKGKLRKVGDEF
jgi:hypothetical protein